MLQDEIVFVAHWTHEPLIGLLTLGLEAFDSLHASCLRQQAEDRYLSAWSMLQAVNGGMSGNVKGLKSMTEPLMAIMTANQAPKNDMASFLSDFPTGM